MTAQDLSPAELTTCARLYPAIDSVLFSPEAILTQVNLEQVSTVIQTIQSRESIFQGTWYGRPFYTAPPKTIRSLLGRGLIMLQEEHKQEFYILNVCEEFKEFFEELKVQIALGTVL